jgi:hypothetical protein
MFIGEYREGGKPLPRVLHLSVARYRVELPRPGEPLEFLVTIHEEGTGISWQQNVTVEHETQQYLLEATSVLNECALNWATALDQAVDTARQLGERLHDTFFGPAGSKVLDAVVSTAILLDVDETILNLPWELLGPPGRVLSQETPFGRLVTTRTIPARGRDPVQEDTAVRFLVVANPTQDLANIELEVKALRELEGTHDGFSVETIVLSGKQATRSNVYESLASGDFDVLHFSGHAALDADHPGDSAVRLADGYLSADDIVRIPWQRPPGLVFSSACESGRGVAGHRLLSADRQANGLAAAFLSAGVYAYAGFFWPVTDTGAALFTRAFYESLFMEENVGLAFLAARQRAIQDLGAFGDLAGYSAVLFGDAASKHRRDTFSAQ